MPSAEAARLAFCGAVGDAVSGAGAGGRPPQAGSRLPSAPLCRGQQISSEPGFLFPCNPVFRALLSPSPALFSLSWLWRPFRHLLSPPRCLPPVFLARALNACLPEAHLLLVFTSAPRTCFLGLPALGGCLVGSCWLDVSSSGDALWLCAGAAALPGHGTARSAQAALLPAAGPQQPGTLPGEGSKRGEAEGGGRWCW